MKKTLFACACLAFAASAFAQTAPFLADRHVARGLKCEVCHDGTKMKVNAKTKLEVCSDCHGDYNKMYEKTKAKYEKMGQENPHGQHDGALACSACHKGHKKGVNYCLQCHGFEFKVP